MDHNFTQQIKDWLDTPSEERDFEKGALYLLKLSGNQIMYRNIIANPKGKADFIEYQLQKYYNFRVQDLTREQVAEMELQVESIVAEHIPLAAEADTKHKGKREDHDLLPDEIKAKFVENLDLLRRMRELHLKLRTMSTDEAPCTDSEHYSFLKELISLYKKHHSNWENTTIMLLLPKPSPQMPRKSLRLRKPPRLLRRNETVCLH